MQPPPVGDLAEHQVRGPDGRDVEELCAVGGSSRCHVEVKHRAPEGRGGPGVERVVRQAVERGGHGVSSGRQVVGPPCARRETGSQARQVARRCLYLAVARARGPSPKTTRRGGFGESTTSSSAAALAVGSDSPLFGETRARIVGALAVLLDAGRVDGTVRTDIDAESVMRAMGAVWLVPDGAEWDAQVRRLLDLVVDGMRFGV